MRLIFCDVLRRKVFCFSQRSIGVLVSDCSHKSFSFLSFRQNKDFMFIDFVFISRGQTEFLFMFIDLFLSPSRQFWEFLFMFTINMYLLPMSFLE